MIHNPVAVFFNEPVLDQTGSDPIVYPEDSEDSESEKLADTAGEEVDGDSSEPESPPPVVGMLNLTCPCPFPLRSTGESWSSLPDCFRTALGTPVYVANLYCREELSFDTEFVMRCNDFVQEIHNELVKLTRNLRRAKTKAELSLCETVDRLGARFEQLNDNQEEDAA
jgi:hypothetical protein